MAGTLVIQPLPGIGDMVWHLPHLDAIARTCPDGRVTVLTKRRSRADELFAGSATVSRVLWLERAQTGDAAGRHDGPLGAWRLAADLAARVNELLADPARAEAMGVAGRTRAVERFGWDVAATETLRLYERLLT